MFLQHHHRLALLHKPCALDVPSEVFLEGDDAGTGTFEVLPVDEMKKLKVAQIPDVGFTSFQAAP